MSDSDPDQPKPGRAIPHPLLCGVAWVAFMGLLGVLVLGVQYVQAVMASEPSPRFISVDQPLSFTILLIQSFATGFLLAWFLRRLRSAAADVRS